MDVNQDNSLIRKLGLGTVQFGMDYGINNTSGEIQKDEIQKILSYSRDHGIKLIDTAYLYGSSEEKLGKFNLESFQIVSKYPSIDKTNSYCIQDYMQSTLDRLNVPSVYGYLSHDFNSMVESTKQIDKLIKIKESGLTKKIGYSLYYVDQLKWLIKNDIPTDIIQIPFSVFDRRFEPYFEICQKKSIEIHIRSVYLQGLVFRRPEDLKGKLKYFESSIRSLNEISRDYNISKETICLMFALANPFINFVIIGVDNMIQMKKNIASVNTIFDSKISDLIKSSIKIEETDLLLPYNWE